MLGPRSIPAACTCLLLVGCGSSAAATSHRARLDLTELVLDAHEVPPGFVQDGRAITQDLYDESSAHEEPWLYMSDVAHGQLVTAAFSEFRSHRTNMILDSETYDAPTVRIARAMFRAAPQVVNRSANGIEARRPVSREPLGSDGILLAGPGLNGEGATALLWRDGRLIGVVGVDGGTPAAREQLVRKLAHNQEALLHRAARTRG